MEDNILIRDADGKETRALLLCTFKLENNSKDVIAYIKNEDLDLTKMQISCSYYIYNKETAVYEVTDMAGDEASFAKKVVQKILESYKPKNS